MNVVRDIVASNPVVMAEAPEDFPAIRNPECPALVWPRQPMESFQSWIDALAPEQLPRARVILRPGKMRDAITQICDLRGTPDCQERARLIDDAAAMGQIFADLMEAEYLLLRLDVVTTNACRKFHIDAVTARLVCTYRGTGTQYGFAPEGGEPEEIFTVPTGAPILLRGTLWPQRPKSGLLHRSPPIEGTGETRLVMVLDPVTEPAEYPDQQRIH